MVSSGWAATWHYAVIRGSEPHRDKTVATVGRPHGSGGTDSAPDVDSNESAGMTGSRGRGGGESNEGSN
jgi:hypothetical protein